MRLSVLKKSIRFFTIASVLVHLQDCISDNPSGTIAKQEITYVQEEDTHMVYTVIYLSCNIKHYIVTQHHKHNVFSGRMERLEV